MRWAIALGAVLMLAMPVLGNLLPGLGDFFLANLVVAVLALGTPLLALADGLRSRRRLWPLAFLLLSLALIATFDSRARLASRLCGTRLG